MDLSANEPAMPWGEIATPFEATAANADSARSGSPTDGVGPHGSGAGVGPAPTRQGGVDPAALINERLASLVREPEAEQRRRHLAMLTTVAAVAACVAGIAYLVNQGSARLPLKNSVLRDIAKGTAPARLPPAPADAVPRAEAEPDGRLAPDLPVAAVEAVPVSSMSSSGRGPAGPATERGDEPVPSLPHGDRPVAAASARTANRGRAGPPQWGSAVRGSTVAKTGAAPRPCSANASALGLCETESSAGGD